MLVSGSITFNAGGVQRCHCTAEFDKAAQLVIATLKITEISGDKNVKDVTAKPLTGINQELNQSTTQR